MATAAERRQKMQEQLDMHDGKKQLNLHKRKVNVNRESFSLVIGLGGTGCQALVETKGLINLTCENPQRNVAYLAIDTDNDTAKLVSSKATGSETLDCTEAGGEFQVLSSQGLAGVFAPALIDAVHKVSPEIFDWVDTRLKPTAANQGAGGIRQMGRLIVLKNNYTTLRDRISNALTRLRMNATNVKLPKLNVFIISGVSGGTGSGTLIDIAYIVRDVLASASGFGSEAPIYGYLFMPDVNMAHGGVPENLQRNAYAAFQELDYNMSLEELGESYDLRWGTRAYHPGTGTKKLFDYVHLVSATTHDGAVLPNAYETTMSAIAQNVLSFVADEHGTDGTGAKTFAIRGHYDNINGQVNSYMLTQQHLAHRYPGYLAIGSSSFKLPIDDIMMYIATKLFDKMNAMFDAKPDEQTFMEFPAQVGVRPELVVKALRGQVPFFANANAKTFGHPEVEFESKARLFENMSADPNVRGQLSRAAKEITQSITSAFDSQLQSIFEDKSCGPVYANRLLVDAKKGLLQTIREWHDSFLEIPGGALDGYCAMQIKAYRIAKADLKGLLKKEEKLAAYNRTGNALLDQAAMYALRGFVCNVLRDVYDYVQGKNNSIYEIVKETMVTLKGIFEENARILTATEETRNARGNTFTWKPITIPDIKGYLVDCFDKVFNGDGNDMIQDFVKALWSEATGKWMANDDLYDPRGFVSRFIDDKFGTLAETSIETVVSELLAPGQTLDAACDTLLTNLQTESAPLFYPISNIETGSTVMLISVPQGCPNILKYINAHKPDGAIVQESDIRDRIYAQTVQCGITLAHYRQIWEAERDYARLFDSEGLHLVAPSGKYAPKDPVMWKDMSTLIPHYLRGADEGEAHLERLLQLDKAHKKTLTDCFELDRLRGVYSARYPFAELDTATEANRWIVKLYTTDVVPEVEGTKLRLKLGLTTLYECDFDMTTAKGDLESFMKEGLWKVGEAVTKKTASFTQTIHTDPDPARRAENTLDYLAEQYITAIYTEHRFQCEIEKYRVIRDYLVKLEKYLKAMEEKENRMLEFVELSLLEYIRVLPLGVEKQAALRMPTGKYNPFAPLPKNARDFELDYWVYTFFCNCCDKKPYSALDRIGEEQRARRAVVFCDTRDQVAAQMRTAMLNQDPACEGWLRKTEEKAKKVEEIYFQDEIQNVVNGMRDRNSTSQEIVDFYRMQRNVLAQLIDDFKAALTIGTAAEATAPVPTEAADDPFGNW